MKLLFIILFPAIIFSQTHDYPDSITTKTGATFPCLITDIDNREVSIIYDDSISMKTYYASIKRLYVRQRGIVYDFDHGFRSSVDDIRRFIINRNDYLFPKRPLPKSEIERLPEIPVRILDEYNKWSFGVTYVPYYSAKIYFYQQGSGGLQYGTYIENTTLLEGQFSYALKPQLRLTLDLSYHSTYEKERNETHNRWDNNPPYDIGSETSSSLKLLNVILGAKYYFNKLFDQNVSAYVFAGGGKQFAFYNEEAVQLFVQPPMIQNQNNFEEFFEKINSPWYLNAGFGAEYSFNKSLSLFSNLRFLYLTRSADYDSRTIETGQSSSSIKHIEDSEITTRFGIGLNFYF